MNRFVKGFILVSLILMSLTLLVGLFIFYKLPSAKSLMATTTDSESGQVISSGVSAVTPLKKDFSSSPVENNSNLTAVVKPAVTNHQITKKTIEDLTSTNQPLSDFCKSLSKAKAGSIPEAELNEAFDSAQSDPRIQATKPLIRYISRLPKMHDLVTDLKQAADRSDDSFVEKAQFYASAYAAFSDVKEHRTDIESILDRSYLFLGLNNLVAKKPELLNDLRVQNFCATTEQLFNEGSPVDFQSEKNHFLSLLQDSGVKPNEIDFNPDYKSNILFNFDGKALSFTGGWLDDLVSPSEPQPELQR